MVLAVILLCALVILAIPAARYLGLIGRPRETASAGPVRQFDLVLAEASLTGEGPSRHIAGTVRNNSDSSYEDVEVSFTVRDWRAAALGTMVARVKSLGPRSTAVFRSEPAPEGAVRIALREVTGTPR